MSKCAKIGFQVLQLETTSSPEAICLECYRSFSLLPFLWSITGITVLSGSKSPDWGDKENCSGHLKAPGISAVATKKCIGWWNNLSRSLI